MTVPEKNDKPISQLPFQKWKTPIDKSIHSQHTEREAGAERRFSQQSLVQSCAQPSNALKHPLQDSTFLYDASQNQNEPESLYENVGFCFTEENEAVMNRVLQESIRHVEKEIALLQESRASHADVGQANAGGEIRSTAERVPNSSMRKKTYRKRKGRKQNQGSQKSSIQVPNLSSDKSGNLDMTRGNEAFTYNRAQLPSPGQLLGQRTSGEQQAIQMNIQPNVAFPYTYRQPVVPSVMAPTGMQSATAAQNHPSWNSIMLSQGQISSLQGPVQAQESTLGLATSHFSMATIPGTIGSPIAIFSPMQPQNGFPQHLGHVGVFQSNLNNNFYPPSSTRNPTTAQPVSQKVATQASTTYNSDATPSGASIGFAQPTASLEQQTYKQNMKEDIMQTRVKPIVSVKKRGMTSAHGGVYATKEKRKRKIKNSASSTAETVQGMHISSQVSKKSEQVGREVEQMQKPRKKRRIAKSKSTKGAQM